MLWELIKQSPKENALIFYQILPTKAQFKRQISHVLNLTPILVD